MRSRGVRRILPALVVATCALVAWSVYSTQRARADEPPYYAIRNARIVPVSGPPVASGTVVIVKGVIQAVGANVTVPPGARVIDGTGLTVYPGLIDAGTDVGLGAPPQRQPVAREDAEVADAARRLPICRYRVVPKIVLQQLRGRTQPIR